MQPFHNKYLRGVLRQSLHEYRRLYSMEYLKMIFRQYMSYERPYVSECRVDQLLNKKRRRIRAAYRGKILSSSEYKVVEVFEIPMVHFGDQVVVLAVNLMYRNMGL